MSGASVSEGLGDDWLVAEAPCGMLNELVVATLEAGILAGII